LFFLNFAQVGQHMSYTLMIVNLSWI
jgi:hypothetical protein